MATTDEPEAGAVLHQTLEQHLNFSSHHPSKAGEQLLDQGTSPSLLILPADQGPSTRQAALFPFSYTKDRKLLVEGGGQMSQISRKDQQR